MNVKIDLSEFTGPWELLKDRMRRLPDVISEELASLTFKVMAEHTPVLSGYLTNSIISKRISPGVWHVGPTAWYAKYPIFYGKRHVKYSTEYHVRTLDAVSGLLEPTANARVMEFLIKGVE